MSTGSPREVRAAATSVPSLEQIFAGLRDAGLDVFHVVLDASEPERHRLRDQRPDRKFPHHPLTPMRDKRSNAVSFVVRFVI